MKKSIIIFSLLVSLVVALFPTMAMAQESSEKNAIYIYRNDGDFNAFLNCDVSDITYSNIDLNGVRHHRAVVQEIHTPDSVYRIPLAAIDSVTFDAPKPVFKSDVFHLTAEHLPYIQDVTGSTLSFYASIPSALMPSLGDVVVSDIIDEHFESGFAGRVVNIQTLRDHVLIECETVGIDDVYELLVCVGKSVGYTEGDSPSGAPRRISIDSEGVLTYTMDPLHYTFISNEDGSESGHAMLTLSPSIEMNYAICYNMKDRENRFKCVVSPILDSDLDFEWNKTFHKEFKTDSIPIKIPTKVPLLFARLELAAFLDLDGRFDLKATQHTRLQANIGYDSQEKEHNGFVFNFEGSEINLPEGTVDLTASLHTGLSVKFVTFFVTEDLASAYIQLKAGPRVGANINFKTELGKPVSWECLSDSHITLEPLVATLTAGVSTLFTEDATLPTKEWSVFGTREYYLFPDFSKPALPAIGHAENCSLTALTTDISKNLLFSVTPGLRLYDNKNKVVKTVFSETEYKNEANWTKSNLQLELNKGTQAVPAGNYRAVPVFLLYGTEMEANSSSEDVIVPDSLSVESSVICVKKGCDKYIQLNDGWRAYTITSNNATCCTATFVSSDGQVSGTSWPPASSGYENEVPSIKVAGKNNGSTTLTVRDKRSGKKETITVVVNDSGKFPVIMTDSVMDFGNIVKERTATRVHTVKGSDLTGNLSVSYSGSSCFTVSPQVITKADAAAGTTITVTYLPNSAETHNGEITISGGGAISKKITITGNGADITVDETSWDFGTVSARQRATKTFQVTGHNMTGGLKLSLNDADGVYSINRTDLPASGGSVTVTFNPKDGGKYDNFFTVTGTNEAASVRVELTGKCADITGVPSSLDFDTIPNKSSESITFTLKGKCLSEGLTLSVSGSSYFTVTPTSISKANANSSSGVVVTVTYHPTVAGDHSGAITIKSGTLIDKTIDLTGKSAGITVTPSSCEFFSYGQMMDQQLTVKGINTKGVISLSLKDDKGVYSLSKTSMSASGGKLTVYFDPQDGGNYGGRITFTSANAESTTVNLTGTCSTISGVPVSPHNFGTIENNGSESFKFILTGKNFRKNLNLSSSNSYFTVSPTSITPTAAENGVEVTVTYHPTSVGDHSGIIAIKCGDDELKSFSVTGKSATLTAQDSEIALGSVELGSSKIFYINLNGENLDEVISMGKWSEVYGGEFSPQVTTATKTHATVRVTYTPNDIHSSSAQFTFKSSGLQVSVNVTGNGVEPIPVIETTTTDLNFDPDRLKRTFKVRGYNLRGDIYLNVEGNGFIVSPSRIGKLEASNYIEVTVTCNKPLKAGEAKLTISSDGASTKYVYLHYTSSPLMIGEVLPDENGTLSSMDEMSIKAKIYAEGQVVVIESPVEQNAVISDMMGRALTAGLQPGRNEVPVNGGGVYIVRVGNKTVKLLLK